MRGLLIIKIVEKINILSRGIKPDSFLRRKKSYKIQLKDKVQLKGNSKVLY